MHNRACLTAFAAHEMSRADSVFFHLHRSPLCPPGMSFSAFLICRALSVSPLLGFRVLGLGHENIQVIASCAVSVGIVLASPSASSGTECSPQLCVGLGEAAMG